jgi:hypothetical protein
MTNPHESYSGIHPSEIVPNSDLAMATILARTAIERKFQDDYRIMITDVATEMDQRSVAGSRLLWTSYLTGVVTNEGALVSPPATSTFIFLAPGEHELVDEKLKLPFLRIIKAEHIAVVDGDEFLTYDLCVNMRGQACFNYGSFPARKSLDPEKSAVPLFRFNAKGDLFGSVLPNAVSMPTLANKNGDDFMPEVELLPFGHCDDPFTKLTVVEKMREIFDDLRGSEPAAWSGMTDQKE